MKLADISNAFLLWMIAADVQEVQIRAYLDGESKIDDALTSNPFWRRYEAEAEDSTMCLKSTELDRQRLDSLVMSLQSCCPDDEVRMSKVFDYTYSTSLA